jgi:UDP-N-acetylglucosamine acyltransferase
MTTIHPSAVIGKDVQLGRDVTVEPYAVIYDGATIGEGCHIGPHAVIHGYTTLGAGCRVHAGAVLGDLPQDLAFEDQPSYVRIGRNCVIREGVTIHRGTKPETATVMGDDCYLMAFSHLGHNVCVGNRVIIVNAALLAGYVEVDDGAIISGASVVHQFVKIGRMAMLGGQSGIGKDIPPYCMTASAMRNRVAGLNVVGLKRAGFSPQERKDIKRAFSLLYKSGMTVAQAVEAIRRDFPEGPASEFWRFAERSNRGLCGMVRKQEQD